MKIICMIKYVPNIENIKYDYEKNVLIRDNVKLILNPDDACAVAFALEIKNNNPDVEIEVVTMGPKAVIPFVEDLLRRDVDKATLISDNLFAGSDSYATSKILGKYLKEKDFDCILTGTHSLDGDTSHVPAQLGDILNLNQMSNIIEINEVNFSDKSAVITVDQGEKISTYEMKLPSILSLRKDSSYKLPYIKYENISLNVSDNLNIISNEDFDFHKESVGLKGSLTKVANTYNKKFAEKDKIIVEINDEGIEYVYSFLKEKGFV